MRKELLSKNRLSPTVREREARRQQQENLEEGGAIAIPYFLAQLYFLYLNAIEQNPALQIKLQTAMLQQTKVDDPKLPLFVDIDAGVYAETMNIQFEEALTTLKGMFTEELIKRGYVTV